MPLSLLLPSRKESRGAGATLLCFLEGATNHQSRAAFICMCAARVSDLAPREQALRGAGYPRGECAQRRGARAPAPQSGVLCRVRGARYDNARCRRFAVAILLWDCPYLSRGGIFQLGVESL